jgi:hypothetical protein
MIPLFTRNLIQTFKVKQEIKKCVCVVRACVNLRNYKLQILKKTIAYTDLPNNIR